MNDIMKPGEAPTEGAPTSSNTLNLRTPEQEAADKQAAEKRAQMAASQGGNTTTSVDGMVPGSGSASEVAPTTGSTMTMEAPKPEPKVVPVPPTAETSTDLGSVFKLPEDQVEQKQGMAGQSVDGAVPAENVQSTAEQPTPEKKPGFFKRLFGGGKKQEPAPQSDQHQNSEQPQ